MLNSKLWSQIDETMCLHRWRLRRRYQDLSKNKQASDEKIRQLKADIEASYASVQERAQRLPGLTFDDALPVNERREDIANAIRDHQVVVLCGETGSGKTTQIPKICMSLGLANAGLIGHTQPRRVAARTVAQRIAEELHTPLGEAVGYKVRFEDRVSEQAYVKVMTDGVMLAEMQSDRFLNAYQTIIIDEAHERSLNIDFLLGYLKNLIKKRRDLKLIITSATIDTERFSKHFDDAPIIEVSGRTYPVEVRYHETPQEDDEETELLALVVDRIAEINLRDRGDILVFLPGEREIKDVIALLRKANLRGVDIIPLFSRLSKKEQDLAFARSQKQKVILATNIAETSITVPGIKYVVDSGVARVSRYSYRSKIQHLPIEKISRANADQRKGRCGRTFPGVCYRLYSEEDYQERETFPEPEICRTNLAAVVLKMKALRLGDINAFPFVQAPDPRLVNDGLKMLKELGALDAKENLTKTGKILAELPVDPRLGRVLIEADRRQCLEHVLVIVTAITVQDPRVRPLEKRQQADEAHAVFQDVHSDFLTFLKIKAAYEQQRREVSNNKLRKWCEQHFISYAKMRDWHDLYRQLEQQLKALGMTCQAGEADYDAIHRSLLFGFFHNAATLDDEHEYKGVRGRKMYIHPGSVLSSKRPKWVMSAEVIQTTRTYATLVAKIEPEWICQDLRSLCKASYGDPYWSKRQGRVLSKEQLSLFGLIVQRGKNVDFGRIDADKAAEIFVLHALVRGEHDVKAPFVQQQQKIVQQLYDAEAKLRGVSHFYDEERLYAFYRERVPHHLHDIRSFNRWRQQAERQDAKLLFIQRSLFENPEAGIDAENFPDQANFGQWQIPYRYRFSPGEEDDGVTVAIPQLALNALNTAMFDLAVPAWGKTKVEALLKSLPKAKRKQLLPIAQCVEDMLPQIDRECPLEENLARILNRRFNWQLTVEDFDRSRLDGYLTPTYEVVDNQNKTLAKSKDLDALRTQYGDLADPGVADTVEVEEAFTSWSFERFNRDEKMKVAENEVSATRALIDQGDHVSVRRYFSRQEADEQHRRGVMRLLAIALDDKIRYLQKQVNKYRHLGLSYSLLGEVKTLAKALAESFILMKLAQEPVVLEKSVFIKLEALYRKQMLVEVGEALNVLDKALFEWREINSELNKRYYSAHSNCKADIEQQLQGLFYPGFVVDAGIGQLEHYPRYLEAIKKRLERLQHNPRRDAQAFAQLQPLITEYQRVKQDKPKQAVRVRWMMEELRVSLFAQELKTAYSISAKKVKQALKEV